MSEALKTKLTSCGCGADYQHLCDCGLPDTVIMKSMDDYGPAIVSPLLKLHFAQKAEKKPTVADVAKDEHYVHLRQLLIQHGLEEHYDTLVASGVHPSDIATWVQQYGARIIAWVVEMLSLLSPKKAAKAEKPEKEEKEEKEPAHHHAHAHGKRH